MTKVLLDSRSLIWNHLAYLGICSIDYQGPAFALFDKSFVEDGEEVILNCPHYTGVSHDKQTIVWSKGKEVGDKILENGTPNEYPTTVKSESMCTDLIREMKQQIVKKTQIKKVLSNIIKIREHQEMANMDSNSSIMTTKNM
uniref:Uncharacterized protein n=1 Tax=Romanomermis culicivorax TaxID=13658 RepID=A0A915KBZ9_ROMCU